MRTRNRINKVYSPKCMCNIAGVDDAVLAAGIGALGSIAGAGVSGVAQGKLNKKTMEFNSQEAEKARDFSREMWDKQVAWNEGFWNKQNEYNSPSAQYQRLLDAGLNPLFFGLDGTGNAGGMSAPQALGAGTASVSGLQNPFSQNPVSSAIDSFSQVRSLQKDVELKNAQIDKLKEDTEGVRLDNEWKDKTLDARTESQSLYNQLTKEQISQVGKEIEKKEAEIGKLIAETDNEKEKKGLIIAETMLRNAEAREVIEMLPYKKLLTEAQTDAQKASAAASYASAAINNGLLKAGYVDKQIEALNAEIRQKNAAADSAEAQKAINEWKLSVRNGTVFDINNYSDPVRKVVAELCNGFFGMISTASEAIGGSLGGFIK